jgi:hypothetical protein
MRIEEDYVCMHSSLLNQLSVNNIEDLMCDIYSCSHDISSRKDK